MNSIDARRQVCRMAAHVNWLKQQQSGDASPRVAAPVKPVEQKTEVPAPTFSAPAPEPVVEPAPAPEEVAPETPSEPVAPAEVNLREVSLEELESAWNNAPDNADVSKEIFRRARKFAKKNKLQLPEGTCEGENVRGFLDVLKTPVEAK